MKKSLGQHFLASPSIARRIAGAAGLTPRETALEVGPGKGMLTRELLRTSRRVVAIEKDEALATKLETEFPQEVRAERLVVYADDALEVPPAGIGLAHHRYAVVANIPYYITGALLRHYLTADHQPKTVVVLVQKEVADQIARTQKESILSLSVKAYGTPQYLGTVRAECFRPRPNVDSAILRITNISRERFLSAQAGGSVPEEWFFTVVRTGFAHKRKLLVRNLETIASRDALTTAFSRAGIAETARPETVPLEKWVTLAQELS